MHYEDINEPVEVLASFRRSTRGNGIALPEVMNWHGRRYRITQIGLRHPTERGRKMLHRFTFSIDDSAYELEFDAEMLTWQLLRTAHL